MSQIAAKNDVPCVILRAMSDNADEDGHEVLVVKKFSIAEYVATATRIVAADGRSTLSSRSGLYRNCSSFSRFSSSRSCSFCIRRLEPGAASG